MDYDLLLKGLQPCAERASKRHTKKLGLDFEDHQGKIIEGINKQSCKPCNIASLQKKTKEKSDDDFTVFLLRTNSDGLYSSFADHPQAKPVDDIAVKPSSRTMNSEADYQKMTIAHIKEELSKRGVVPDAKAKKSELIKLLQKAEEDAILNHSDDGAFGDPLSTPDEDLLNDDVLNDVLPEKLMDDESVTAKEAGPDEIKSTAAHESEPEKNQKVDATSASTNANDPLALDAKLKRAQRFGLPVGITDPLAKAKRAQRFGVVSMVAEKDLKVKRAARFGTNGETVTIASVKNDSHSDEETKKKLLNRAQRFGLPVNENGKVHSFLHSKERLEARAKRFGLASTTTIDDSEMEAKKKARLERFGIN
ncbi:hypothetical protein RB195_010824 [Necator americanus]